MKVIYWLAIFIVLLIIEIATMGLTTIWFAGGASHSVRGLSALDWAFRLVHLS